MTYESRAHRRAPMRRFLDEQTTKNRGAFVTTEHLWQRYTTWLHDIENTEDDQGFSVDTDTWPRTKAVFVRDLLAADGKLRVTQIRILGTPTRVVHGLTTR